MNESNQETTPSSRDTSNKPEVPAQPQRRATRIILSVIRWFLGLLIIFGLGALSVLYTLYIPSRETNLANEARLLEANQTIQELEEQVSSLSALEGINKSLQGEIDQAYLHILTLSALSNINAARISVANNDIAAARILLTKADILKDLAMLVEPEQRVEVATLLERLALARSELDADSFAAQSDLEVLAANLAEFNNSYFSEP